MAKAVFSAGRARNGMTRTPQEAQNAAVTARLYASLLPEGANGLIREPETTGCLGEEDRQAVAEASDKMAKVVRSAPGLAVEKCLQDYKQSGWEVNGDNMEEQFMEVQRRTFSDDVHWGRVIAFLAFSVSFAAYVASLGIKGGAESVFRWTNRVLDKNLADFMKKEKGWRGFNKYADTLLKAQEKKQRQGQSSSSSNTGQTTAPPGVWDSVATYGASIGAIGLGALVAIGVRQAFS